MKTSPQARFLITQHEGLRLKAYQDDAGIWTIGYGHTRGVKPGKIITKEEAIALLNEDIADVEDTLRRLVTVFLEQHQYDALASFVFNIGEDQFASSTLLRKLNQEDMAGAAYEFDRWIYCRGKILPGLITRRADERQLFESTSVKGARHA